MILLKLWDVFNRSKQTIWNKFIRQKKWLFSLLSNCDMGFWRSIFSILNSLICCWLGTKMLIEEVLSVLMLSAPVFIFTAGRSAILGHPRYGLSMWLSLLAIFNILVWVCHFSFTWKRTKHEKSPPFFILYENGRRLLLDAQSINTERASIFKQGTAL